MGPAVGHDRADMIWRSSAQGIVRRRLEPLLNAAAARLPARDDLIGSALLVALGCFLLQSGKAPPTSPPSENPAAAAGTETVRADPRSEAPSPAPAVAAAPVTVLVAAQRTILPRVSDTPATARKERLGGVAQLVTLRVQEDRNFALKARNLGHRMQRSADRFPGEPERVRVRTGADFLDALVLASRSAPIGNLVIYGHSAPTALYMREDRGFYASVAEVAEATRVVEGAEQEKENALRALGARDLADLAALIENGTVRFAPDAVIIFTGCAAAGHKDIERDGIAARTAAITGAAVFASIDVTDQSMAGRRAGPPELEYSRRTWVRFGKDGEGAKLNSKVLDPLKQLRPDAAPLPAAAEPVPSEAKAAPALRQFWCAADTAGIDSHSCGAGSLGDVLAVLGERRSASRE
jgi:hypothetical protein